jgi:hypothetical protein
MGCGLDHILAFGLGFFDMIWLQIVNDSGSFWLGYLLSISELYPAGYYFHPYSKPLGLRRA